jgi:hypothetical protein
MPQQRTIPRDCQVCGAAFLARGADVKAGKARFCSLACRDSAHRGTKYPSGLLPNRVCEVCGVAFRVGPGAIVGIGRFCSNRCRGIGQQIPLTIPDSRDDLIYMAGIVDGEGTITAGRSENKHTGNLGVHCKIMVANSHEPLMDWMHATYGGSLSAPRKTRKANHKPITCWYLGGVPAVTLCKLLLPFLKVKRRQAEIVIALGDLTYEYGAAGRYVTPENRAAREPLIEELRLLNHRGLLLAD